MMSRWWQRSLVVLALVAAPLQASTPSTAASTQQPAEQMHVVNVNVASVEELCTLPGIGRKKAEAIVALRTRRPLTRVTQLLQVKGIGPKTLQRLKPRLSVTPAPLSSQ